MDSVRPLIKFSCPYIFVMNEIVELILLLFILLFSKSLMNRGLMHAFITSLNSVVRLSH